MTTSFVRKERRQSHSGWSTCTSKATTTKDAGAVLHKTIYGRGIMINKRGVHEGYYNKDMKNGRGRMIYFDGRVYEGEWKENLWHGNGTIDFQNGSRYEG